MTDRGREGTPDHPEPKDEEELARKDFPPDASEADVLEQSREWERDEEQGPRKVPIDAPEADVLDDSPPERRRKVPIDAPEADVLDQSRPADLDDEDRDHG